MKDFFKFFTSKILWRNLGIMALFLAIVFFALVTWLKSYTNHGERVSMPNLIDLSLDAANEQVDQYDLNLIVNDSVHIVGKGGGIILNQNPNPDNYIKKGRSVYLTVTKSQADMINIADLPTLYGQNYERKKKELKIGYQIESSISGRAFDPGPEGHILKVISGRDTIITRSKRDDSRQIKKGGKLSFILSKNSGGEVIIPDLTCLSYSEAKFLLESYKLKIGSAEAHGVDHFDEAYVFAQSPVYAADKKVAMGSAIDVFLQSDIPPNCQ